MKEVIEVVFLQYMPANQPLARIVFIVFIAQKSEQE